MEQVKANKEKKFTLSTVSGCLRLLALFCMIIVASSFFARLISTDFGNVRVKDVTFDARGAMLNGELYIPRGTSDRDSLPAVIVTGGGGTIHRLMRLYCSELARRGYVVLNVSAYGTGLSEMPTYLEDDMTGSNYNGRATPQGLLDALNYVRTLKYVDQYRIGMAGHSFGSRRVAYTAVLDAGYYSYNDIMINVLHETFGQSFSREEINRNADSLAEERLNSDQLYHYNGIKTEQLDIFNRKVRSLALLGSDGLMITPMQKVSVAGHEVERNCQVNIGYINGVFEPAYAVFAKNAWAQKAFHTEDIKFEQWYVLDDVNESSTIVGDWFSTNHLNSRELSGAIDNRATRVYNIYIRNTHSKAYWSPSFVKDTIRYFESTLNWNNGNLTDSATVPLDPANQIWPIRNAFNFIAMVAMIGLLVVTLGLLVKTKFFKPCVSEVRPGVLFNKKIYAIFAVLAVAATIFATHAIRAPASEFPPAGWLTIVMTSFWPVGQAAGKTVIWVFFMAIFSVLFLVANCVISKKKNGITGLEALNLKTSPVAILKSMIMGVIVIAAGYCSMEVISYLFKEDYRLWMASFYQLNAYNWLVIARYTLYFFPAYAIISCGINYTNRTDIPEWKDTLYTVIIYSVGVWILTLGHYLYLVVGWSGVTPSPANSTYQFVLIVPMAVYLIRKSYKITKNVWVGAMIVALLVAWSFTSTIGTGDTWIPQTWWSNFLAF